MPGTPEYEALVERLRVELTKAEEDLCQATTPESKRHIVDRLRQALADFTIRVSKAKSKSAGSA